MDHSSDQADLGALARSAPRATETRTCDQHGDFESTQYWRDQWSSCRACGLEDEQRRVEETKRLQREDRQCTYRRESGILGRFVEASFETFTATSEEQRVVLQACRDYATAFHRDQASGLWLIGPPGTGKTHLGAALVNALITEHTAPAKIASAREIIRRLRSTWRRESPETEEQVIDDYASVALLVVDEIGVGFGTEGEQTQLFDVLDKRYQLKRPTVILSNLTAPLLKTALGDRLYDRMREGAKALVCQWPSHRGGIQ